MIPNKASAPASAWCAWVRPFGADREQEAKPMSSILDEVLAANAEYSENC